ncbi:hypothetical protein PHAMO_220099 [Magnetospirillum molischianum DSM 120]|uniref:Uncharacterized protein n=1 Tax=Magnetospirillum molischianum DSM 120 TaxID=1150626 RepID=H8FRJ3_MAGML|nr:hypothetical protein PHAMO_220099 [Magnetospirillum molischianum DSM 120]
MVEGARLESVYTVLSRIEGSNPSPSANSKNHRHINNLGADQGARGVDVRNSPVCPSGGV